MAVEDGSWIMKGVNWDHPECIHNIGELEEYINEVGFLPLFANDVEGFSVEEWTEPGCWWCEDPEVDPWIWREIISGKRNIAYGKFFDKKAGYISLEWLPYFANARRDGYDFSARWEDGRAGRREKMIMDVYIGEDDDGNDVFNNDMILSTDLKKQCGFGKGRRSLAGVQGMPSVGAETGSLKNYQGIVTGLMMQTYLVIVDFKRRVSKKGEEYGMPVSIMLPPESVWGYDLVTSAYDEKPSESWQRIYDHVKGMYEEAEDSAIIKLIGKKPED